MIATLLTLSGCGNSASMPASPGALPNATGMTLTSTAILPGGVIPAPGGVIPARFTCDGEDVSPEVAWSGAPDGTGALVLVVDDPDAGGFVHWIVLDLAASPAGSLPEGVSGTPAAPQEGTNDFGRVGWNGPCPPSGEHRYRFTLHAVAAPLALPGAPGRGEVRDALDGSTMLATAVLEATYARR